MRVGVNLLWLRPGQVGGSEEMLTRLLTAVAAEQPDVELVLFALPAFVLAHPRLVADVARVVSPPSLPAGPVGRALRVALEQVWLPAQVRQAGLAVVHHGGGTVPRPPGGPPTVLHLHDLQYLTYPATFSRVKRMFLERSVPSAVARADHIVVPSEFVAGTVHAAFGRAGEVTAVGPPAPTGAVAHLARTPPTFVLPGITYAHKNHRMAVRALAALRAGPVPDARLLFTGARGPYEREVMAEVAALDLTGAVERTGRLRRRALEGYLAAATALVFPSRYEGFGLPAQEAMAAGLPVVAADATALPEVVGDAGLLVPPDDADGWAAALASLVADHGLAADLSARGLSRAASATAARSAAQLVDVWRSVA